MKSLTVGLVLDDSLDRPDGVQQMVLRLGEWLRAQGHDVHYIVSETKRADIQNIHSVARSLKVSFNGNVLRIPRLASKTELVELCNKYEFDVLHVQMPYSPFMSGRLIANTTVPVVGTFHILPYGSIASVGTQLLGAFQAETLRRFRRTSATSVAAQQFAERTYRVKPEVIPNPVDLRQFAATKSDKKRTDMPCRIVFLGRLVERKGALHLLKALAALSPEARKIINVDIVGDGPDGPKLRSFVQLHKLQSQVTFHGFVDEGEKPKLLAAADIAVFPSTAGESFGIVLVEAMASGAGVVIGGNNPGYRCVLGDWPECLFDPTDSTAFARTLEGFISDKSLRNRLGRQQSEAVKQYDIAVVGKQFLTLYDKAILDSRADLA